MKKISFDFDNTLDNKEVQKFASKLITDGVDVWIHTSRFTESDIRPKWNDDIYEIANITGIPKKNIIFTEMYDKYIFFKDNGFIWHLDDKKNECKSITNKTSTTGIHFNKYDKELLWKNKCVKLLK